MVVELATVVIVVGIVAGVATVVAGGIQVYELFFQKQQSREAPEYERLLKKYEKELERRTADKTGNKQFEENLSIALEEVAQLREELRAIEAQELEAHGLSPQPEKNALEFQLRKQACLDIEQKLINVADHFTLGVEAHMRRDWSAAQIHYEAALAEERTVAVLINLGIVYRQLSRLTEALTLYKEAEVLLINRGLPENWQLAMNRGNVYYSLGQYEEALVSYDKAEKLRRKKGLPEEAKISFNCAIVLERIGENEQSLLHACKTICRYSEQGLPVPRLIAELAQELTKRIISPEKKQEKLEPPPHLESAYQHRRWKLSTMHLSPTDVLFQQTWLYYCIASSKAKDLELT